MRALGPGAGSQAAVWVALGGSIVCLCGRIISIVSKWYLKGAGDIVRG